MKSGLIRNSAARAALLEGGLADTGRSTSRTAPASVHAYCAATNLPSFTTTKLTP